MSLNILVDMNLSPDWIPALAPRLASGSLVYDRRPARAADRIIMDWAIANRHVVFTHDLDFGTTLALTHAVGPSVLQVRGENVLPDHMETMVVAALQRHETDLIAGALVVVDAVKFRVRILPLR